MNAAIYVRVSTSKQEDDGTSLATQEECCRVYAGVHGYQVEEAHVYREVHTGVELWEREKLNALRDAVRRGEVQVVIAYAIDRLARDPVHLGVVISEAEYAGVSVCFVTEPLDHSPEGELIRFVRGYAAKVEHEKIRERVMRGKRARVVSGKLTRAGDLYGYCQDKGSGRRVVVESEALIARQIFCWVDERVALRWIARHLNEQGTPPPSAGKRAYRDPARLPRWQHSTLLRILREPAYKGESIAWRWKSNGKQQSIIRSENEWIRLPEGTTPPLVSEALWESVQRKLNENRSAATRNAKRRYLLRGLIQCAVCGRPLYSNPERGRLVYRCSSKDSPGGPCGAKRVRADLAEAWVWEKVAALLKDPETVAREISRRKEEGPDRMLEADRQALLQQLARVDRQQEKLLRRYREADDETLFPWELVEREIAMAEQEKRALRQTLSELEEKIAMAEAATLQLEALSTYCARVAENLSTFGWEEKRLALAALSIAVVANGSGKRGGLPYLRLTGAVPLAEESSRFGHNVSTLCAPAAATSRARLAWSWPFTSAKSRS